MISLKILTGGGGEVEKRKKQKQKKKKETKKRKKRSKYAKICKKQGAECGAKCKNKHSYVQVNYKSDMHITSWLEKAVQEA